MKETSINSLNNILKLSLLIVFTCYLPVKAISKKKQPNIIIILTDDQGYGDFSFSGNPEVKTPNIDKLWNEGIKLTNFHVAPMCTPTRGALMTGKDALKNGAFLVCSGYSSILPEVPTMPEILKEAGYKTGIFGKWHLGDNYPHRPTDRGFDTAVWHKGWGQSSVNDFWNNDYFNDYYWRNDKIEKFKGYCTDFWFDEAMNFMNECNKEETPFFAYLSTNAPHGPHYVDDKYRKPYKHLDHSLASYFGMIANIDENMGRLVQMLKDNDLYNNTIIIFTTDNGGTIGTKLYNAGLRGTKKSLYDGGHRVPCSISWPLGNLSCTSEISELIQVQDILPTLLDFCSIYTVTEFDGASIAPLLMGKKQQNINERSLVVQYGKQPYEVLELPQKYNACVMHNQWRLVNHHELYNIYEDRDQKNDIAQKHPKIVDQLQNYYENWWNEVETLVYNKHTNIHIGSVYEPVTILTSEDWQTINTANQFHIRQAKNRSGAWNVFVEDCSKYKIELYRWPKEAQLKLTSIAPVYKAVDDTYMEGKALPIAKATIKIGKQTYLKKTTNDDYCASFEITLPYGETQIETCFYDEDGNQLCGAYYVYISKSND